MLAAKALRNATQEADDWHLVEDVSRVFLDAVRKSMRQIRSSIRSAMIANVEQDSAPLRFAPGIDGWSHITKDACRPRFPAAGSLAGLIAYHCLRVLQSWNFCEIIADLGAPDLVLGGVAKHFHMMGD